MIRALFRGPQGDIRWGLKPDELAPLIDSQAGLLWVDLQEEPVGASESILAGIFNFHPLAVDDALQEVHIPKVDDWGDYVYTVLHAVDYDTLDPDQLVTLELDIFLGPNYLITYQEKAIDAVDKIWHACERDARHLGKGPDHLLYRVADELVNAYMPVVEKIDDSIEEIEDQIFDDPRPQTLERLFSLKRALLRMRRILTPQREVFNKLGRDEYAVISAPHRVFFRDLYDHVVRLHDINESLRDLVGGALETYLSVVNNRMNDVMKTLTLITTLFMPISFLAGFFGMNFFQPVGFLPVWTDRPAFLLMLVLMAGLPVVMFWWVRSRGWM
jgi:magnesium transporter